MKATEWLPHLLLMWLLCLRDPVEGMRIYKSRNKVLSLIGEGGKDTQQYFGGCTQSTNERACMMAIDSEAGTDWPQCAITEPENGTMPWWKGELEVPIYVTTVFIQNAVEWGKIGETDGLLDFTISGNGHICYTHNSSASFASKSFPCDILADEIEIKSTLPGAMLALCDVQAFGVPLIFPNVRSQAQKVNFASCTQSSSSGRGYCWNAVDGNDNQAPGPGQTMCSMTQSGRYEWWRGVLEAPALVQQIIVFNRKDCCQDKLINFAISIGDRRCVRYHSATTFTSKRFLCNHFGNDVKVLQLAEGTHLSLCEVIVYGHAALIEEPPRRKHLGCFAEKPGEPDLNDFGSPASVLLMDVKKCDRMCRRLNATHMGLKFGSQCWCGSSYGKHGTANGCTMTCDGNMRETCGGTHNTDVYELKYQVAEAEAAAAPAP